MKDKKGLNAMPDALPEFTKRTPHDCRSRCVSYVTSSRQGTLARTLAYVCPPAAEGFPFLFTL